MLTVKGSIDELNCKCGFSGLPSSFMQVGVDWLCPLCGEVVVTLNTIVQEVLRMDDEKKKRSER